MTQPAARRSGDRLTLEWLPGRFVVCRLRPDQPLPRWIVAALEAPATNLVCLLRTQREVALVIDEMRVPGHTADELDREAPVQRGFIALRIAGIVDFTLVGVFATLTGALAEAGVSVFVISTYDTDILMVRESDRARAEDALRRVADIAGPPASGSSEIKHKPTPEA
jgi:uncharacterized protein